MDDKPKRRWPRISLRALFVVLAGISCWLAWIVSAFRSQDLVGLLAAAVASFFIALVIGGALLTWLVAPSRDD